MHVLVVDAHASRKGVFSVYSCCEQQLQSLRLCAGSDEKTDRQTTKQTDRQTEREIERERGREGGREGGSERERQREREGASEQARATGCDGLV